MSAHTPGPWSIATSADKTPLIVAPNRDIGVAFIPFQRDTISRQPKVQETESNARLIAAAPDLLFQLLAASNYIDALGGDSKSYRAAIAKATGSPT